MDILIENMLKAGFALIPVPYGQKGPTKKEWNSPENCIRCIGQAAILQNSNIGLAHAYCSPSPTCAIDIDNFKKSCDWLKKKGVSLKELVLDDEAVVIWSGKPNSLKLLYRLPIGIDVISSVRVFDEDRDMIFEFRCATASGKTVQDILPPSTHPTGTQYQWMGGGSPLDIPTIPDSLLEIWREQNDKPEILNQKAFTFPFYQTPETPREIARVKNILKHIDADCSRDIWLEVVWGLLSSGWVCSQTIAEDWSKTAPHRFNEEAFEALVTSYNPNIDGGYTLGTVVHHAKLGGWNE